MEATNCLYKLEDTSTGAYYVGSAGNLHKRLVRHRRDLINGKHHCKPLQGVFDSVGWAGFSVSFVEFTNLALAREAEQKVLDYLCGTPVLFNIGKGAIGGDNLSNNPNKPDITARIGKSLRLMWTATSKEYRSAKLGKFGKANGMYGKTHTPEARAIISATNSGEKPNLRKPKSEAGRFNIGESARVRAASPDYRNNFQDKHHTDETKAKLRAGRLGKLPTNTRGVVIEGKPHISVTEASRCLGVCPATIIFRINSENKKFSNYSYAEMAV